MATKRLTLEEARERLGDADEKGMVWALNYDSNGIPGDWVAMSGMVDASELDSQYAPFVLTTEGENEAIDATVLTLGEQIDYEGDRVENAEELGIDRNAAMAHLKALIASAPPVGSYEVIEDTGPFGDIPDQSEMGDEANPTTPQAAVDRLQSFVEIFDDHDPSLDMAITLLNDFILKVENEGTESLEWGGPDACQPRIENDADLPRNDRSDGSHYGLPHCIWCLQAQ